MIKKIAAISLTALTIISASIIISLNIYANDESNTPIELQSNYIHKFDGDEKERINALQEICLDLAEKEINRIKQECPDIPAEVLRDIILPFTDTK